MKQFLSTVLITAAFIATSVSAASAASCNPQNTQELVQLLVRHSPFKGKWEHPWQPSGGKTIVTVRQSGGQVLADLQTEDWDQGFDPTKYTYSVKLSSTRNLRFQSKYSTWKFELQRSCELSGSRLRRGIGWMNVWLK